MVRRETRFDLVFDSQKVFRVLLQALSRPGTTHCLPAISYEAVPEGLNRGAFSVLKTLLDGDTTYALSAGIPSENHKSWQQYIRMNTSAVFEKVPSADYALFDGGRIADDFSQLKKGIPEFPEDGATALVTVEALSGSPNGGKPVRLILKGPGVQSRNEVYVYGFDPGYAEVMMEVNRCYPMGIDMYVIDRRGCLIGIPRTNGVEVT